LNVPSLHLCQAMPISCQDFPNYSFVGIENLWSHGLTTIRKKIQIWRQSNGGSRTFQHLLSWKFKGFIMFEYPSQFMPLPLLPHTHTLQNCKLSNLKMLSILGKCLSSHSWKFYPPSFFSLQKFQKSSNEDDVIKIQNSISFAKHILL
jgi:hypothetical protein